METAASEWRPRLDIEDTSLIVTALRQYASGKAGRSRRVRAFALIDRFTERNRGNPNWVYQTTIDHFIG